MEDIWLIILIYLAAVNLFGLIIMGVDKSRAKRRKWRIPEATLFLVAVIGGSIGSIAGMYLFRHKTKHWYFVVGMPVILVLQLIAVAIIVFAPLNLFFM
ncbi:MAG: DUF1294 domain-containing protein [Lachnospiraceae bacterium]|nr:DUF1294 domain-containing protein [Lachnospiraceae bacterium]